MAGAERGAELPLWRAAPVLGVSLIAALLAWAFVTGKSAQIVADAAERAAIAQEDRTLCTDLGLDGPEPRYARCLSGLADVRRKQKDRWDAAIQ